jgi:hypothetical protein
LTATLSFVRAFEAGVHSSTRTAEVREFGYESDTRKEAAREDHLTGHAAKFALVLELP